MSTLLRSSQAGRAGIQSVSAHLSGDGHRYRDIGDFVMAKLRIAVINLVRLAWFLSIRASAALSRTSRRMFWNENKPDQCNSDCRPRPKWPRPAVRVLLNLSDKPYRLLLLRLHTSHPDAALGDKTCYMPFPGFQVRTRDLRTR